MSDIKKVSIKINVGAYNAYRNMQNKAHYAIAEYVDNAIQSYLNNSAKLRKLHGQEYKCRISIDINHDEDYIEIIDNAGGIYYNDFIRAFEPANIPLNTKGLHEFGMGMKIASIWLADKYTVTSTALGEKIERHVLFDLKEVIKKKKEELNVKRELVESSDHYTKIRLTQLSNNAPKRRGGSVQKVKNHITSIYRKFLSNNEIELIFNGEKLTYTYPNILTSPFYDNPKGIAIEWKERVNFESGPYKVKGFIGLLETMKSSESGFSLFRRGRVIKGSHDEKYKTKILSGQIGSPLDKRLFGEFELEGFNVSFDKGSFLEMEDFEELLVEIKASIIKKNKQNIFRQGSQYRKISKKDRDKIIRQTLNKLKAKSFDKDTSKELNNKVKLIPTVPKEVKQKVKKTNQRENIVYSFPWQGKDYDFKIQFIEQSGLDILQLHIVNDSPYQWLGTVNLAHNYFAKFKLVDDTEKLEPVIEFIKSLLISEVISKNQGTTNAGYIRMNLNKIL